MIKTLKYAAAAAAVFAAAGAYAGLEDGRPDNTWIAKDVATIHMEPQVVISANELPAGTYNYSYAPAPLPSAAAYGSGSVPSADGGTLIEQTTITYYTVPAVVPTSPMVDTTQAISPN